MTLNARFNLKCALRTARFMLRVSDSTVRIGVAREGRGSGLEGLAPSMWAADALFLCGTELLVRLIVRRSDHR